MSRESSKTNADDSSSPSKPIEKAKNFYLNERQELVSIDKDHGRPNGPNLRPIAWAEKSSRLRTSFREIREKRASSSDPTLEKHFFLVAQPDTIPKFKESYGTQTDVDEEAQFRSTRSADLVRLGLDVLDITESGDAIVHALPSVFEQMERTASNLLAENVRARNRWVSILDVALPQSSTRLDKEWLATLSNHAEVGVIEFQPVLNGHEVDQVLFASLKLVGEAARPVAAGRDYSGRQWFKSRLTKQAIKQLADAFFSIQLIHAEFGTILAAARTSTFGTTRSMEVSPPPVVRPTPIVALLDTGSSTNHPVLAPYRFPVGWTSPLAGVAGYMNHPSYVASRIVFGELERGANTVGPGDTSFFDVAVGILQNQTSGPAKLDDKDIIRSMQGAQGTSAELRTFVLPFDTRLPTALLPEAERREKLRLARDLDNYIAESDISVIISSGNVRPELVSSDYPGNIDEPVRQLGPFASTHNAVTCGSFVRAGDSLLASVEKAPSPFSRVGPGFALATAVPEAAAHGGGELGGATVVNEQGQWVSKHGTSLAAPVLAREFAHAYVLLREFVPDGTRVSSALVKAFLALTATTLTAELPPKIRPLAKRTLGFGSMSAERLRFPSRTKPTFLWQGVIPNQDDVIRVVLPFPGKWFADATSPTLRIVTAWNTYVNDVADGLWACRRVELNLKTGPNSDDATGRSGSARLGGSYPLSDRRYNLSKVLKTTNVTGDGFVVCLSYKTEQMAPYPVGIPIRAEQPVAFVAEYLDETDSTAAYEELIQLELKVGAMDRLRATPPNIAVRVR